VNPKSLSIGGVGECIPDNRVEGVSDVWSTRSDEDNVMLLTSRGACPIEGVMLASSVEGFD